MENRCFGALEKPVDLYTKYINFIAIGYEITDTLDKRYVFHNFFEE